MKNKVILVIPYSENSTGIFKLVRTFKAKCEPTELLKAKKSRDRKNKTNLKALITSTSIPLCKKSSVG